MNKGRSALYCKDCGLLAPLPIFPVGKGGPCSICGGEDFVDESEIRWRAALTWKDRIFLLVNRISDA